MLKSSAIVSVWFTSLLIFIAHPASSQTQQGYDRTYDAEFFSIKYPSSWHISSEHGITGRPGEIGVNLRNGQNDINNGNRITPRSNMDYSSIIVSVIPRSSLFGSDDLKPLELVNSLMDYVFSEDALAYNGAQLIADNYTSLSQLKSRSVSFTTEGYYNLVIESADESNLYQIAYIGQESKTQKELPQVLSIMSSFQIKGITDNPNHSTI